MAGFLYALDLLISVVDRFGQTLFDADESKCLNQDCLDLRWFSKPRGLNDDETFAVASPRSVFQLTSMLRGVTERGRQDDLAMRFLLMLLEKQAQPMT